MPTMTATYDMVSAARASKIPAVVARMPTALRPVGCAGKRAIPDRREAGNIAVRMRRKHGLPLEPYRCRHCSGWHVGSPSELYEFRA